MNYCDKTYQEVRRIHDLYQNGEKMSFEDSNKLLTIMAWLWLEKSQSEQEKNRFKI